MAAAVDAVRNNYDALEGVLTYSQTGRYGGGGGGGRRGGGGGGYTHSDHGYGGRDNGYGSKGGNRW